MSNSAERDLRDHKLDTSKQCHAAVETNKNKFRKKKKIKYYSVIHKPAIQQNIKRNKILRLSSTLYRERGRDIPKSIQTSRKEQEKIPKSQKTGPKKIYQGNKVIQFKQQKQRGCKFERLTAGAGKEGIKPFPCPLRAQHEGVHGNKEGLAQFL